MGVVAYGRRVQCLKSRSLMRTFARTAPAYHWQKKELELLLAVASVQAGLSDRDLIDDLWPDSDGDAARNAFRVCLHRLRKSAGDARIVTRVGRGYVLHPWADVDLWRFQPLVANAPQQRRPKRRGGAARPLRRFARRQMASRNPRRVVLSVRANVKPKARRSRATSRSQGDKQSLLLRLFRLAAQRPLAGASRIAGDSGVRMQFVRGE